MARPSNDMPELGSDADDDEALCYAIALSLQDQGDNSATQCSEAATPPSPQVSSQQPKAQFGSLFIDRKSMEEERLRRLAKRRRSSDDDDVVEMPPPKRPIQPIQPSPASSRQSNTNPESSRTPARLAYPSGTIKRTWVRGYARTGDDITIEEVFQKDHLELAVLSSFQWDEEWMLSKLDMSKTKLLLLAFAKDDAQKDAMRANVPPSIKFCFPPMHGLGAMHSKLQLLKYTEYLRIVIPTGNLVPYDWGETGVMENMAFLIDLPRLESAASHHPTNFSTELEFFLRTMGVNEKMIASLSNYDFSKTADIAFVHTIPGSHIGETLKRVGYCGLGASVVALGLASPEPVEVDLACASLGSINRELVGAIYNACQGGDGLAEYNAKTRRKPGNKAAEPSQQLQERFRIYFPTNKTVSTSRGGRQAGGTICVQEKWWRSPSFPRELLRDSINTRDRLLMHSKVIFVRQAGLGNMTSGQSPGWAYVGSANLSESAWGRLSKDRATGKVKMNCRNWECGVIVPVPKLKADKQTPSSTDMMMFAGTVPVPMLVPGPVYGPDEQPWFFSGA